jgi:hypothetical protein
MKVFAAGVLCACLFLSGCSRQQVNQVSVFEYEASDDALMMSLKTSGNIVPWVVMGVAAVVAAAPGAALEALAAYANSR